MCGITGFLDFKKITEKENLIRASNAIKHRGPDDYGHFFEENESFNLGVANQRLAIIDLSEKGHQPRISSCGNYILVFNGTIYNYKTLRNKLQKLGFTFTTNCDTEVLLNAYIAYKKDVFNHLDGTYSFCIIDKKLFKILIARDKIGVKPLFFHYKNGLFCFGSEIKAVNSYLHKKLVSKKALAIFLKLGYFLGEDTIFEDIFKLKPGHLLEFDIANPKFEVVKYWELPSFTISDDHDKIVNRSHQLLKQSVISRTVADTDIGILLSGGYDSALTTAIIKKHSKTEIKTFTIGFEDEKLDESKDAKKIADYLQTNHFSKILTGKEAINIIKNLGHIYDEPMGDSGAVALYEACKLASEHVKVLLSSEGGDELFGGYKSYKSTIKWSKFFKGIPKTFLLDGLHPKFSNLFENKTELDFFINYNSFFNDKEIYDLIEQYPELQYLPNNKDTLNQLLDFDLQNYLPEDLLMKADRTNMYWGIENRDPFLGIELVEYLSKTPQKNKFKNDKLKSILIEISNQYIPKELMERPKKGFSIPLEKWLKNDLKEFIYDKLYNSNVHGLIKVKYVNEILNKFYAGKKGYSRKLWILLSLQMWADVHLVD